RTPGDRCQSLRMVTGCSERGGSLMRGARLPRIAGMALVLVFAGGCDFVVRASVDTTGGDPDSASLDSSISDDGRYVAFWSGANDLVPGDTNSKQDVFVRD